MVLVVAANFLLAAVLAGSGFIAAVYWYSALGRLFPEDSDPLEIPQLISEFGFPLPLDSRYSYVDSWHAPRDYGGDRKHLGTDIMCRKGTPVLSVCSGFVERKGWDTLGGWRVGIRGDDGNYYYYAHNSAYSPGLRTGCRVRKGQLLALSGNSGYGPPGTSGKFAPHLHFGIYDRRMEAINPYPYLRKWENSVGGT